MQGLSSVADAVVASTDRLFVAPSPIHGTGVFAARPFSAGEVIECCPVVVCPGSEEALLEQTQLRGLYFHWGDTSDVAVALGYGSLYNHAWSANARYETDVEAGVVRFVAVRPLAAGDEVTINYTGDPEGRGELWFEPEALP